MNKKTALFLKKAAKLATRDRPFRGYYQELKQEWKSTPRNQRGNLRASIQRNIELAQKS